MRKAYQSVKDSYINTARINTTDAERKVHLRNAWIALNSTIRRVNYTVEPTTITAVFQQLVDESHVADTLRSQSYLDAIALTGLMYSLAGSIMESHVSRDQSRQTRREALWMQAAELVNCLGFAKRPVIRAEDELADLLGGMDMGLE